ncbi:MAG TPA: molybdenum ABC transporter ATP-binding protein [Hydrogenophaga sp.]|uniref:molybdenum ABC transporter ATP-binding protein n=1 Tax=Hydrogenophaga sp. TaxID=1904254 RepID=UPI0008C2D23B|nr:molybdenum ABC transporter ATP-binding protein [Hydrogenophaga sp.]OGA76616.1 MAG: molybdenum ABC transporter ATP-binding protein [Burkholderiales bacterium GWE1_65_30]OGA91531.1 MAG: molybdenum ABC transporter ATP-binding protein [Burkholderiales bacterium GWF1_66_17]HAX19731.1 molybdenum ABC transporter ATP-binding protein [Hydrogenophaga sp.]HBU20210.1 molybdenum ABC transporter ATP-binding protein [Hydrogenophaga sp.]
MSAGLTLQTRLARGAFTLDLDLTLPGRGLTALFGASGSGKTTCLRVLAGLEPAASGRLSVGGELWQDSARGLFVPPHQRALGYVFQEASLFDHLSVQDNIRFGYRRTPAAQRRYGWDHGLELLGIGHLLQRMPHELSGGERQRVAMARALATSPRVLLMDEPLAALDAPRKAEILPWLEQLHQKLDIPVVYVTHSADEVARLADHLVLLEQGRVMAQGPVLELMTRTDLPLAHGDSAGALVEAVTCGLQSDSDLCELRFDGGTLLLPQTRATPLPDRTPVRVRIQARDVSLSLVQPEQTSVLNCLPATVADVSEDGPGQVLVGLRLGQETRLLSRISRLSCERLGIAPGLPVYAQIKGVAMVR